MSSADKYHQLMKLIIVGDSGTGKSCLLHRFVEDTFTEDQTQTIGVEFGAKLVNILGKKVKLQIWDTAGQERYKSVTRSYYRGALGALIVYDVTSKATFDHIPQWLNDVRQLAGKDVTVMLVGNKSDMGAEDKRQVTYNEGALFAQQNGLMHFETSAVTGEFVSDAFLKVAKTTLVNAGVTEENGGEATADGERTTTVLLNGDEGAGGYTWRCQC